MKKIVKRLLILSLCFIVVGCTSSSKDANDNPSFTKEEENTYLAINDKLSNNGYSISSLIDLNDEDSPSTHLVKAVGNEERNNLDVRLYFDEDGKIISIICDEVLVYSINQNDDISTNDNYIDFLEQNDISQEELIDFASWFCKRAINAHKESSE